MKSGTRKPRRAIRTDPTAALPRSPMGILTAELQDQSETLRGGGSEAGQKRQRDLGRLSARQRVARLCDPLSEFFELNLWAAWRMYPQVGDVPAAGVITGVGIVHGHPCMIIANDAAVKAGAFFPATVKKVLRAQRIATRCNLPLVYLVDSAGVYLPMQDEIFPDEDDFGRIFRNNAVISAMGIPQYAAIMGNCVAGGAYLPVLCDKILMTEGSQLALAGPALVKAALGQVVDPESLGGATMHAQISGTVDFVEKDDDACLKRLRSLIALLPAIDNSNHRNHFPSAKPMDVYSVFPPDGRAAYDTHELLRCFIDSDSMQEYKADYGKALLCVYAQIDGTSVGVIANQRALTRTPREGAQIGGVIYHDSADKAARFVMDCSQSGLPLIFVQDVQGFMVGRDSEQAGVIRSGAKLVNAVSNATVPKITLIVGGSFGAGNYALCGKAFDPTFIFAWPNARYAVMGAEQASQTLLSLATRQAERSGQPMSAEQLEELHRTIAADYTEQTDIRYGAARGWVDAIIPPHSTREVLVMALTLATRSPPRGGFRAGVIQV
jgi:3-methylcrotonyl-CoA carboxylase beta subunit